MPKPFVSIVPSIGYQHLGGQGLLAQGTAWFVRPNGGADAYPGRKPDRAKSTLAGGGGALSAATAGIATVAVAGRNDVVYLMAESDTAASTTDYQTTTLTWDRDLTHLVGVNSGSRFSSRSRIAFKSSYTTASNLMTVSANGCLFQGIEMYAGVASANPTGCLIVSGERNVFRRCHIAGIGHANNDIASAYSLYVSGQENVFEDCVIGLDTIDRGSAANSEIYFAAGALRNYFKNCIILSRIIHATNHPQVQVVGGAMGNPSPLAIFDNCMFINTSTNYLYTQTYAIKFTAAPTDANFWVFNCTTNATNWAAAGNKVYVHNPASLSAYTGGVAYSS